MLRKNLRLPLQCAINVTFYDPEIQPEPKMWLSMSEQERLRVATTFHARLKPAPKRLKAHSAMHVYVETQIARGFGPAVKAMRGLLAKGLSRHDALHEIGIKLVEYYNDPRLSQGHSGAKDAQVELNRGLEKLAVNYSPSAKD